MTDWRPIKSIPDTTEYVLVTGPNGYIEASKAEKIRAAFVRGNGLDLPGFWWAPIDPVPSEQPK